MAGLYIHLPFCRSKCLYCDFFSTPALGSVNSLPEAIAAEYARRADEITEPFKTVYIGGGTPSILPPDTLRRIIESLPVGDAVEFTIEANPDDITPDVVKLWRDMGVNRVSLGVQSFDDRELKAVGRRHDSDGARRAIAAIIDNGIANVSADLIYGLPGQDIASWKSSLLTMLSLGLPHISAYCLTYEPGTVLHSRLEAGKLTATDDRVLEEMYMLLCSLTVAEGYRHYEISNFALPGMHSRHNSAYWTDTPYLGLGPGAHSFDGKTRRYNLPDLKKYLASDDILCIDNENEDQRFNDVLITALRTAAGLHLTDLPSDRRKYIEKAAAPFLADRSMTLTPDGALRITEEAWFRSDAILRELIVV